MRVYLVRHGVTDFVGKGLCGRLPGIPLNDAGQAQARGVADYLRRFDLAAVYSSPLERAVETAEPIGQRRAVVAPGFIEVDHGRWAGLSFDALENEPGWREYNANRSVTRCPGGEIASEVVARAVGALDCLRQQHGDDSIAIVTHADVIRAVVCYYAGIPVDLGLRLEVSPGSISVLDLQAWGPRIIELNRTLA